MINALTELAGMRRDGIRFLLRVIIVLCGAWGSALLISAEAYAALTVTPSTWNIIGLDSNTPAFGPNRFPVGAKVCSSSAVTDVPVTFSADSANPYIYLRPGSLSTITIPSIAAGACADAYFEVEVTQNSAAFDTTLQYHISAPGASTPMPRELYVEHLISQSRNAINNVKLNGVSIPAGGAMNLVVGNTYTIELYGGTATQGYEQFEAFINFPNTIFQVLSVNTSYSADDSPYVANPDAKLYADACLWENDPNSPYYLSCVGGDYKAGGSNVVTTYTVKIVGGGGSSEILNTLLYDFSGSSFHYNADYSTGARYANIIDPTTVTISKGFTPNPTNVGGVSTLTFTLANPNPGAVGGLNFSDNFPAGLVVANPSNAGSNGCGAPVFAPVPGAGSVSFSSGTVAPYSNCTVQVNVTAASVGSYANVSNHLFVGTTDTGKFASATLTVDATSFPLPPPPAACGSPVELARWTMDPAQGSGAPPAYFSKGADVATATAGFTGGGNAVSATSGSPVNSWGGTGWAATPGTTFPSATTAPWFDFVLDTSKYGGARVAFDYAMQDNGDWQGPADNRVFIYSSANGGAFNTISTIAADKGAWRTGSAANAAATGSSSTTFRFNATGAGKAAATLYLDNVIFYGCPRPNPPTIAKTFLSNPVAVNGSSTLRFTLTNPNSSALTGVKFADNLPPGLEVAAVPALATTCAGLPSWAPAAGATVLNFGQTTGATIPAGGSCTVSVDIKATSAGPHDNVSGFVTSAESGANTGSTATASLTALVPPSISKRFTPTPILAGGVSTLTFAITNPNQNNALSGVAFSDTFPVAPGAMKVAAAPVVTSSGCGAGAFSPVLAGNEGAISFAGATVAAGGTCTVTVNVTAPVIGSYANTSGNVSHLINSVTVNGNAASATLTVNAPNPRIGLLKQVSTGAAGPWASYVALPTGGNVYYRFTVENTGDVPLSALGVTDPTLAGTSVDPAGCAWTNPLPVASPTQDPTQTCVRGPVAALAGNHANTATAHGTYSAMVYDSDPSTARYATTGLTVAKSATQSYFAQAGDLLQYSFLVTNSGAATIAGPVTVADDKAPATCPAVSTVGDNDNYLDPGEAVTCTASYTVVAADVASKLVTNTASASAGGVTSATVSKTVPLAAELTASKTNSVGGSMMLGGTFNWMLTAVNAVSAGSANFANGQTLLTDELPDSGATYVVGAVAKTGATGTINCAIAANTLSCTASGTVTIPPSLQGTLAVTNGSATATGAGTAFLSQLAAGGVMAIAGVPYTVASIQSDTQLTLSAVYAGASAGVLTIPASFSVPVTVTPTAGGSLVNPKSGGVCKANPAAAIPEIDTTNNSCADTVTVLLPPILTVVKSVQTFSDPVNGTTNPRSIPGAVMQYSVQVVNSGAGVVDSDTLVVTDVIPANTVMCVSNSCSNPPVAFICSATPPCGLTYAYGTAVTFSNQAGGGAPYGYTPAPDADGYDANVTGLRVNPSGSLAGASGGNNTEMTLRFRVRLK